MSAKGMKGSDDPHPIVTRKIAAEAATWIARLHGPDRSPKMEQEVRDWLAKSAAHRRAFEKCTDIWQDVACLTVRDVYAGAAARSMAIAMAGERRWARWRWPLLGLGVLSIAAAAFAAHCWWDVDVYATKVGEQQQVVLEDGTRMSLNTDTRVRVDIDADLRSVQVAGGEAIFEVAKDPHRPFVVKVADSEVVAVGTVFSVRVPGSSSEARDEPLAVTLIEGQISVRAASGGAGQGMAPAQPVTMQAGERIVLAKRTGDAKAPAIQRLDRPHLDQMVAWKRGEAVFDNVSLPEAVTEMNRYTRTPIVLIGDASKLRVSGLYHTGDSPGFARAVAALHGLQLRERGGRLELAPPL